MNAYLVIGREPIANAEYSIDIVVARNRYQARRLGRRKLGEKKVHCFLLDRDVAGNVTNSPTYWQMADELIRQLTDTALL